MATQSKQRTLQRLPRRGGKRTPIFLLFSRPNIFVGLDSGWVYFVAVRLVGEFLVVLVALPHCFVLQAGHKHPELDDNANMSACRNGPVQEFISAR